MSEIAIITGAASGIGKAIAVRLAARGVSVVCADKNIEGAKETASQIKNNSIAVECDVTEEDSISALVSTAIAKFGRIDNVVANAGIALTGSVLTMQPAEFDRIFDVNVRSVFLTAHYAVQHLIDSGGTLTAISSDSGLRGAQGWPAYSASKHAVIGLVKSMALDFAPHGVRVNAVCPGWVHTSLMDKTTNESQRSKIAGSVPMGRLGTPEDVAESVAFLTSEAARYVTGIAHVVDGGQFAGPFDPAREW